MQQLFINLHQLLLATPTNLLIVLIICVLLKLFGKSLEFIGSVIAFYICVVILFGVFGVTVPPITSIVIFIWNELNALFSTVL